MKSKEEILNDFGCPEVPFNENVTMYYPAILSAMEEYASQQAPAMYKWEQVEKAIEFGFNQCANNGCISTYEQKQFIESIK